jgi:hypothetical protein
VLPARRRVAVAAEVLVAVALALGLMGCNSVKAAPEQPIKFPHTVHAGTYKIPCQYCHSGVSKSQFAGIPAVGTCMGCHRIAGRDLPEVKKLTEFSQKGESIPWTRVHDLPDFVHFAHYPHIQNGVQCVECHGDIPQMQAVRQVAPLNMGWCVTCHQQRKAPTDCLTCHF